MLVDAPLAARRASMTRVDGAKKADGVCIDARTGASIRGSSMATRVLGACRRRASRLSESFRDAWLMRSYLGLALSDGVCTHLELRHCFSLSKSHCFDKIIRTDGLWRVGQIS